MRLARVSKRLRAANEPTPPEIARYGSGRILGEKAVQPTDGNVTGVRDLLDGELGISELRLDIGLDPASIVRHGIRSPAASRSARARRPTPSLVMAAPSFLPLNIGRRRISPKLSFTMACRTRDNPHLPFHRRATPRSKRAAIAASDGRGSMITNASISGLVIVYPSGCFVSIRVQSPSVRMQVRPLWTNVTAPSGDRNEHHRDWQCRRRCGQRAGEPIIGGRQLAQEHLTERAIFDPPRERIVHPSGGNAPLPAREAQDQLAQHER